VTESSENSARLSDEPPPRSPAAHLNAWLAHAPRAGVVVASWVVLGLLAIADYSSHQLVAFDDFYLVPIAVVAWYAGRGPGATTALLATVAWAIDNARAAGFAEHPIMQSWSVVSRLGFFAVVTLLVAALKQHLDAERRLARVDSLTGVANRRGFEEAAFRETRRCQRYGKPFSIAYLDVDDFKRINDDYGHRVGDELLACLASTLRRHTRASDTVGRIGGDEFVVLLPETAPPQARRVVEKLREELGTAACARALPVTFSVGVVTFVQSPSNVEEMLSRVDQVMYDVKRSHKDSVLFEVWPVGLAHEGT
jgi:diguanylate cyclase (GGDEF)-like protein